MEPTGPIPVDKQYPGIPFHPPDGTINPKDTEGEILVKWKKVDDQYTMVEIDGRPISTDKILPSREEIEAKKERMRALDAYAELDQIAQLYPT